MKYIVLVCFALLCLPCGAQDTAFNNLNHEQALRRLYTRALSGDEPYRDLRHLCKGVGQRLSGSEGAARGVQWGKGVLDSLGLDSVWLQPVMVPHWERGPKEQAWAICNGKRLDLDICALGGSVATVSGGLEGEVIAVRQFDQLDSIGADRIKGKIVYFNRPFNQHHLQTFRGYGGAVGQRVVGAIMAARFGAAAVLIRSAGSDFSDHPHTGVMYYADTVPRIPAAAVSVKDAMALNSMLEQGRTRVHLTMGCRTFEDAPSFNVIGEIKGYEHPEEVIVVGGHMDSWDLGEGAHDDGAGCVQSIEVLRLFRQLGYRPKHTIRCVLFMNEENGSRGGKAYAADILKRKERHLAAMESDRGGFTPRGFSFDTDSSSLQRLKQWAPLFQPYLCDDLKAGGGGSDIHPIKKTAFPDAMMIGYIPDGQRYFDYHHTAADVFEAVNRRELILGAAAMAGMIYLLDDDFPREDH